MEPPRGEGDEPPPQNDNEQLLNKEEHGIANQNEDNEDRKCERTKQDEKPPEVRSATCKPVASVRPKVELPGHQINAKIQYMKYHALIWKFIGLWLTEKALRSWINAKWHPKGHITLQLGPKGFFTATFNCLEDKNRVLDGGPYFVNAAGLFLRGWVERFNLDKEDLS